MRDFSRFVVFKFLPLNGNSRLFSKPEPNFSHLCPLVSLEHFGRFFRGLSSSLFCHFWVLFSKPEPKFSHLCPLPSQGQTKTDYWVRFRYEKSRIKLNPGSFLQSSLGSFRALFFSFFFTVIIIFILSFNLYTLNPPKPWFFMFCYRAGGTWDNVTVCFKANKLMFLTFLFVRILQWELRCTVIQKS